MLYVFCIPLVLVWLAYVPFLILWLVMLARRQRPSVPLLVVWTGVGLSCLILEPRPPVDWSRQAEAKWNLREILHAQKDRFAQTGRYTDDVLDLGLQLEAKHYLYTCGLAPSGETPAGLSRELATPGPQWLPEVEPQVGAESFRCFAVGSIDDDPVPDVWWVDETGAREHHAIDDVSDEALVPLRRPLPEWPAWRSLLQACRQWFRRGWWNTLVWVVGPVVVCVLAWREWRRRRRAPVG